MRVYWVPLLVGEFQENGASFVIIKVIRGLGWCDLYSNNSTTYVSFSIDSTINMVKS